MPDQPNQPTKKAWQIGDYRVSLHDGTPEGGLWVENKSGEAAQFGIATLERAIKIMWREYF